MPLRVVVIVEGHGEGRAIRTLLNRIWYEHLGGDSIEVIPWRGKNDMPTDLPKPDDAEGNSLGKSRVKEHLPRKYKETVDQPRFVGHMSLTECIASSRSFRKLVKELQQRLPGPPTANDQQPPLEPTRPDQAYTTKEPE